MEIWIPSRGRPNVLRETLQALPRSLDPKIRIACTDSDPQLQTYHRMFSGSVLVCVFPASGIAEKRRMIGENVETEKFFMMDDDIRFFKRKSPEDWHLIAAGPASIEDMLGRVDELLDEYAAVGISAREGNNRLEYGVVENTRLMRAVGFVTEKFNLCEHERVDVMEDFDILLQLLRSGYKNANLTSWAQDQRMTNAPGGCSVWRTHELHDASARKLAALHPEFVKLRKKENKTGGEFGTRTEVTISWKKAYNRADLK